MKNNDMLGRAVTVTVEQAQKTLYDNLPLPTLRTEQLHITEALGRVLAQDVTSEYPLPEFPRSVMDGYAVIASDTYGATESMPAYMKVAGEIAMGAEALTPIKRGELFRISTGGMLPPGADAVVMLEHTQAIDTAAIEVTRPVAHGENVVQTGDDVAAGEVILTVGHRLRPQDIGALAGIGVTSVMVYKRPIVSVLNTGNEIVEADKAPAPGQVRDINSYNLAGLVTLAGGEPVRLGIFRDEYAAISGAVEHAIETSDIVAITGGSSVGTGDLTAKVINDMGLPGVVVHGVAVRPGKPVIIGIVRGKPVFGLPGHPVAVTVSFELFLRRLIKLYSGERDRLGILGVSATRVVEARMSRNFSSTQGREDHLRVALSMIDGQLWARPILGKSGLISTLVKADGTVVIPLAKLGLAEGESVEVRLFD